MVWLAMNAPEASAAMVVRSNWRASPQCVIKKPPLSMISAVVASLFSSRSLNTSSSSLTSSTSSWGRVAMSCVLRRALGDVLVEQHARDHVQRFKNAFAFVRGAGERGNLHFAIVQQKLHVFNRRDVRQITLVILQNIRNVREVHLQRAEVFFKVLKALNVLGHLFVLRIGDKHDAEIGRAHV